MREGKFNKSVFAPSVSQNNCVFSCFFFFPGVIKIYIFLRLIVRNVSEFDTETSLLRNQKQILKCTQTKKKKKFAVANLIKRSVWFIGSNSTSSATHWDKHIKIWREKVLSQMKKHNIWQIWLFLSMSF